MKKKITTLFLLALGASIYAQDGPGVGIGNPLPSQSAMLDINATNKGVLIPRIELKELNNYQLELSTPGGIKEEGILIYNKKEVPAKTEGGVTTPIIPVGFYYWTKEDGGKWELVTNESRFSSVVSKIEKIEKIVGIGGEGDTSGGTVIFRPEGNGKLVIKKADGTDDPIALDKLIRNSQINTFFRIEKETVKDNVNGVEKNINVTNLYYFGEQAISEWLDESDDNTMATAKTDMPLGKAFKIDISQVVGENFTNIFNNSETKETIEKIIQNVDGNVSLVKENVGTDDNPLLKYVFYRGNGEGDKVKIDINEIETITKFGKSQGTGTAADNTLTAKPTEAAAQEKGKIFYTYYSEDNTEYFIDITSDMLTVIKDNQIVRDQIVKVINNPAVDGDGGNIPGGGEKPVTPVDPAKPDDKVKTYGNVYYGPMDPKDLSKGDVLYSIDSEGNKHYIELSQNIINEITNNEKVKETIRETVKDLIKELTTVKVESGKAVETGEVIGDKKVFKGFATISVEDPAGYDSTFKDFIEINAGDNVKFGRLLKVSVLNVDGQVVVDSATDVETSGDKKFKFYFGVGNLYTPIATLSYDVVYEFLEK